jgi:archaellum component FlaC
MITTDIHLTEDQRGQLLDILDRRFRKMSGHALLELERLTRHPVDLAGFQAQTDSLATDKAQIVETQDRISNQVINSTFSRPVNRREFLAYSASGLLGLMLLGTGYGWSKSNESVDTLMGTMADVEREVAGLADSITGLQNTTAACRQAILEFQTTYPQTTYGFAQLKTNAETVRGLYNQLEGTGMQVTEIVEFLLNLASINADIARFAQPISTMVDVVRNTASLIALIELVLDNLSIWFSDENDRGINRRLLFPAQLIFDTLDNDTTLRLQSLQARLAGS